MVISHQYGFIFIKTAKTAGTSIEVFLSEVCGERDVVTPIEPAVAPHRARNHRGSWNPVRELAGTRGMPAMRRTIVDLLHRRRFYNHLPALHVRARVPRSVWRTYFKFCVEWNPWDKTLSHYHHVASVSDLTLDEYLCGSSFAFNHPLYTDTRGAVMVDRVLRYENLDAELADVFASLGIRFPGSLGTRAKSEYRRDGRHYREVFNPAQHARVGALFREEIALHGYQF